MSISARIEDYMEEIFSLEIEGRKATVTELASRLGVTKATVVSAVRRLVAACLLEHEPYGALHLTEAGRERALRIYRRHEHLSFLFAEILGIEKEKAVDMACALEHAVDEESEMRLLAFADFVFQARRQGLPWVEDLLAATRDTCRLPRPLVMIPENGKGVVARVTAGGLLRKRLLEMGLVPGSLVEYLGTAPLGDPLHVRVHGTDISLRRDEATTVWVCPCREESGEKEGCAPCVR
ncbi:metal-dependent transcriptional regulator [Aminiphilus sp.]|jgi:DtxR family Mn-dependent transcriptional regulator|uniref:metal-dependent transcriptional regulator n=1 Tax=Aminiphilus sp. TaxID=1872488 RepID=UPI002610E153|nr:metal-dependent transcriptional regulator [Aminiphilus sp.]